MQLRRSSAAGLPALLLHAVCYLRRTSWHPVSSTILPSQLTIPLPLSQPIRSYTSNMSMCKFPLLATQLAAAGVSSFRFDHACAVFSKSERQGPFLMGNHVDEVQDMADAVTFMRSQGRRVVCLLGHRCG